MGIELLQIRSGLTKPQNLSEYNLSDFDLMFLIATLKSNYSLSNGDLQSSVLFKSKNKQIVLTAMPKGTEIESFQSNDSVSLQIIEGKLQFHIRKESITVQKDQLVTLKEHIKYRLTTMEQTIFLLTISTATQHREITKYVVDYTTL